MPKRGDRTPQGRSTGKRQKVSHDPDAPLTADDMVEGLEVQSARKGGVVDNGVVVKPSAKKPGFWAIRFESDGKLIPQTPDKLKRKLAASDDEDEKEDVKEDEKEDAAAADSDGGDDDADEDDGRSRPCL